MKHAVSKRWVRGSTNGRRHSGAPPVIQAITRLPFSSSFEDGTVNAWDTQGGSMPVTTTEAYLGSRSSMVTLNGSGVDNYLDYNFGDALQVGGTATGMNDIYIRFAHKWSSNYDDGGWTGLQKLMLLNLHNPSSGVRRYQMTFNMWTPTNMYFCEFLRWTEGGSSNGVTTSNIDLNVTRVLGIWIEFVFHVRMNTPGSSDGILRIWTKADNESNHTLRVDRSNINYRDSDTFSPNRIIQSNYQPSGLLVGTRYWDAWLLQQEPIL